MAYNYAPFYQPNYFQPGGMMTDMANQFKSQYQQPPMQNIAPQPTQSASNDMIWVQGESGAKAYLVAPNTTVTLWDSENSTIYIKSADASGMPSMRVLDFTERTAGAPTSADKHVCQCGKEFVKKSEFEALQGEIDALREKIDGLTTKANTKSNKKGDAE